MTTFENLVNSLTLDKVQCIICGSEHDYTDCTFIRIQCYVIDNVIQTRARLTMPGFLQLQVLADGGANVVTNETIMAGTCFGPVEGEKADMLHPNTQFPLKLFNMGADNLEEYYLECLDETKCNWMMFIKHAEEREEQNLICYQEGDSIYYVSMREIQAGESLKVWYGSFYANKINSDLLKMFAEVKNNVDVNMLVKKQQKIIERKSWICKYCGKVETFVTVFAQHMIEHYKTKKKCDMCKDSFRTLRHLKKHMQINHASELTEKHKKLLKRKEKLPKAQSRKDVSVGGPLLNDIMTDSLDNTSMVLQQTALNNMNNEDILLEPENANLNVDNLINDNVKQLDHFNFEIDDSPEQFICDICLKEFSKITLLVDHLRQHTGEFVCDKCLKVFPRKENLVSHLCNRTTEFECQLCEKKFSQKKYLRRHIIVVHENTHRCEKCKRRYSSQNELLKHNCALVPEAEKQKYICPECGKVSFSGKSLQQHMKKHLPNVDKDAINIEMICNECGELFTNRKSYYSHMELHKEPKYKCDNCDKKFYKVAGLKDHVLRIHGDPNESPVTCDICNKNFKNTRALKAHKPRHNNTGEKLKCSECEQMFTSVESRKRHYKRIHGVNKEVSGESHKCPVCPVYIKLKTSMQRHVKQKHPDAIVDIDAIFAKDKNIVKSVPVPVEPIQPTEDAGVQMDMDLSVAVGAELANSTENLHDLIMMNPVPIDTEPVQHTQPETGVQEKAPYDSNVTNVNTVTDYTMDRNNSNMLYDCDLEFETILNEPTQGNYERYFSFDDIDDNNGLVSNPTDQGNTTTGNDDLTLETTTPLMVAENPSNIVVYIVKQNGNSIDS